MAVTSAMPRTFWRARDAFFERDETPDPRVVPPMIVESWRRSLGFGLRPDTAYPVGTGPVDPDHLLLRAARPVVNARIENLADLPCGVVLTDHEATVLDTFSGSRPFAELMRETDCLPGFRLDERDFGTLSPGLSLVLGSPALVVGGQHFSELAHGRSSAAVPMHHPLDGRVLGTINFACEVKLTTPLMLHWAKELARLVRVELVDLLGSKERALLHAYLGRPHRRNDPVLYVNEKTFIASAAASRLAAHFDRSFVADLASSVPGGQRTGTVDIPTRESGATMRARWETVENGGDVIGIALHLGSRSEPRRRFARTQRTAGASEGGRSPLADLAGTSPVWLAARAALEAWDGPTPLLIAGEPGTGKTTIAERLRGQDSQTLDAQDFTDDPGAWLADVAEALSGERLYVLLEDLHLLPETAVMSVCDLTADAQAHGVAVLATWSVTPDHEFSAHDSRPGPASWPGTVAWVPPLRERAEDLADLLHALTHQHTATYQVPAWAPDTLALLQRVQWHENLRQLERVVTHVLRRRTGPVIRPGSLPDSVLRSVTRRPLAGLERVEAEAIVTALKSADGNKRLAAHTLGISRSTLHRKLRAYGLNATAR